MDLSGLPRAALDRIRRAEIEAEYIFKSTAFDLCAASTEQAFSDGCNQAALHLFHAAAAPLWERVRPDLDAFKARLHSAKMSVADKFHLEPKVLNKAATWQLGQARRDVRNNPTTARPQIRPRGPIGRAIARHQEALRAGRLDEYLGGPSFTQTSAPRGLSPDVSQSGEAPEQQSIYPHLGIAEGAMAGCLDAQWARLNVRQRDLMDELVKHTQAGIAGFTFIQVPGEVGLHLVAGLRSLQARYPVEDFNNLEAAGLIKIPQREDNRRVIRVVRVTPDGIKRVNFAQEEARQTRSESTSARGDEPAHVTPDFQCMVRYRLRPPPAGDSATSAVSSPTQSDGSGAREAERTGTAEPDRNERPPRKTLNHRKAIGRFLGANIDRLRKECGWTFDDLSKASEIGKKLILGHVNKGKGATPKTLWTYADTFSEKLGREVTVAELEGTQQ